MWNGDLDLGRAGCADRFKFLTYDFQMMQRLFPSELKFCFVLFGFKSSLVTSGLAPFLKDGDRRSREPPIEAAGRSESLKKGGISEIRVTVRRIFLRHGSALDQNYLRPFRKPSAKVFIGELRLSAETPRPKCNHRDQ